MNKPHVIVVGAGASGLMAASVAGMQGAKVTILEKNEKAGKKIYITGKGRCNVTNACDVSVFFENIVSNPKFMYKSFYAFDNKALMDFIEKNGTRLKIERGDRVFPVSDHASDITKALINSFKNNDIKLSLNKSVKGVLISEEKDGKIAKGIKLSDGTSIMADSVILACGGASYKGAGGCRDGFEISKNLGIEVKEIAPSLVPFLLKEDYTKEMQGLALKNISLSIYDNDKKIYQDFGELLFTHFGMSGPLVLTASAKIGDRLREKKSLKGYIDLKPALTMEELDKRLIKDIKDRSKQALMSFLGGLLPKSMQPVMLRLWEACPDQKVNTITGEQRNKLLKLMKAFPVTITGTRGFDEAVVTKGGVSVKEINPSTMEIKKIKNLYVCGEMVDVDALTGGFNLQCAFSMGYVAGLNAAKGENYGKYSN